ncbi:MAG: hypothetical protein K8W52_10370 [Deltaproteobacteria bacterium]|nr:hypothetical protein [Deltaproteobacteria bacterium]
MSRLLLSIALAASAGCTPAPTGNPGDGGETPDAHTATRSDTLAQVAITSLPGASVSAGIVGTFVPSATPPYGHASPPRLSNTVVSALPGTPPKPVFVAQDLPYDAIIVAIDGKPGYFAVPADGNTLLALDLVAALDAVHGPYTVLIATKTNGVLSAPATLTMVIDPHVFVTAGDLENHDSDESNVADMFGTVLERKQGSPPAPTQVEDDHNNNADIVNGIKGPAGPLSTGHREVVWDGVPEALRNKGTFNPAFFDRQAGAAAGVQGGIIFTAASGTGLEVNDALDGATPDPTTVGPPTNQNASLGGDFSNHNPAFAGDLLSFTQSASFAPLGTTTVDITFHVAASSKPAVVDGLGIVFTSVDKPQTTYVEFFDEQERSIARVYAPVQSPGPFPVAGPLAANKIPFSFAGYIDHDARIAHVRVVSGELPVDTAASDMPAGNQDVVIFDDVYYGEPRP